MLEIVRRATLPNLLSCLRLPLALGLLYFAWIRQPMAFLLLLGTSVLSDFADGYLARKLDQITELGAQLDSWGDLAIYLAVPVCAWWLWPELILQEAPVVIIVGVSYTLTTAIRLLRYRPHKSFHTRSGKLSGVRLGCGALLLLTGVSVWPLRFATAVVVISDIEEIAMMAVLPRWKSDVPSLWHAMRGAHHH